MNTKPAYRPDIDGLRAVAVLGVLLYHYGATWLPGGFTGVDVFFVISGYLITGILRREIEAGEFSLLRFYDRRIRRILPALLVVLATTMVAGWFLLMPGDYAGLGESAAYAAFGLGNLFFFWNTGYFDQAADLQPLLHTWSLGVEEQFYVVWPMALLALFGLTKSWKVVALATVMLVVSGFIYAAVQTEADPTAAFYLPHPRAWELGIGALLAFAPTITHRVFSEAARILGAFLITYSFLSVSAAAPFPGINAVHACVGSALLIWPTTAPTTIGRVLSLRPVVGIGLISYSLYLWHWPVIVMFRHLKNGYLPDLAEVTVLVALTFGLSYLSWRFVENPRRKSDDSRPVRVIAVGAAVMAAIAVVGTTIVGAEGFARRVPSETLAMSSREIMWDWPHCEMTEVIQDFEPICTFGAPWESANAKVFVWGDSHADHLSPLLLAAIEGYPNVAVAVYGRCVAAIGPRLVRDVRSVQNRCGVHNNIIAAFLADNNMIDVVLFAGYWDNLPNRSTFPLDLDMDPFEVIWGEIGKIAEIINKPYYVVADIPAFRRDPTLCQLGSRSGLLRLPCEHVKISAGAYFGGRARSSLSMSGLGGAVIDPGPALCAADRCMDEVNGHYIYRDSNHLRRNLPRETNRALADMFGISAIIRGVSLQN